MSDDHPLARLETLTLIGIGGFARLTLLASLVAIGLARLAAGGAF